jgi:hypothetical protein
VTRDRSRAAVSSLEDAALRAVVRDRAVFTAILRSGNSWLARASKDGKTMTIPELRPWPMARKEHTQRYTTGSRFRPKI